MAPERADNCFSLHTKERTMDFEVDNPWLVLLVVRALRLFLGAHYDTLPAPTFFSHLCVRPRGTGRGNGGRGGGDTVRSSRADSPKQAMVWTSSDKDQTLSPGSKAGQHLSRSTPTERASGDSASDASGRRGRRPSPWDGQDVGGEGDSDSGSTLQVVAPGENARYPPPPDDRAPGADFIGDIYGEEDEESAERSPGGVMALFSSSGAGAIPRSGTSEGFSSSGGLSTGGSAAAAAVAAAGGSATDGGGGGSSGGGQEEAPLTASQLLATKGMTKRLNLSKKLSAANKDTGPLKGKRFDLMALPMDPAGQLDRRDRGASEHAEAAPSTCFVSFNDVEK